MFVDKREQRPMHCKSLNPHMHISLFSEIQLTLEDLRENRKWNWLALEKNEQIINFWLTDLSI